VLNNFRRRSCALSLFLVVQDQGEGAGTTRWNTSNQDRQRHLNPLRGGRHLGCLVCLPPFPSLPCNGMISFLRRERSDDENNCRLCDRPITVCTSTFNIYLSEPQQKFLCLPNDAKNFHPSRTTTTLFILIC
jgi:hypothetical protein